MEIKDLVNSKKFKMGVYILAGLVIVLFIFQIGMFIGVRKAGFAYGFGDNYYRTFEGRGGSRGFMMGGGNMMGFPDSHGTIGQVVSVTLPTIVVQGRDGIEKVVLVANDTSVIEFRGKITSKDISVGDLVTVVGSPNDKSQIVAKLIRIMPGQMMFINQGTSTTTKYIR